MYTPNRSGEEVKDPRTYGWTDIRQKELKKIPLGPEFCVTMYIRYGILEVGAKTGLISNKVHGILINTSPKKRFVH